MTDFAISSVPALIVDGVRFELKRVQIRPSKNESHYGDFMMWIKATSQSGPGLAFSRPLYFPNQWWARYDSTGTMISTPGTVLKARTWHHYGMTGYDSTPGAINTPIPITTLSPHDVAEEDGSFLAFDDVRLNVEATSGSRLRIGGTLHELVSSFLVIDNFVAYQVHSLGYIL